MDERYKRLIVSECMPKRPWQLHSCLISSKGDILDINDHRLSEEMVNATITANTALSGSYLMTLGEENLTNATGNVGLVRIALSANQKITSLSIS